MLWPGGQHPTAELGQTSLAGFGALGCPWGRCTANSALALARANAGQIHASLELHQASVALARETGDPIVLARCLMNLSVSLTILGPYDVALPVIEECCSRSRDAEPILSADAATNLTAVSLEFPRQARSAGGPRPQWAHRAARAALVLLDRHAQARCIFSLVLPHYVATDGCSAQLFVQRHLGWSLLECGEWQQAMACAEAHHALVGLTGRAVDEHRGLEIQALALEQAGRWLAAADAALYDAKAGGRDTVRAYPPDTSDAPTASDTPPPSPPVAAEAEAGGEGDPAAATAAAAAAS